MARARYLPAAVSEVVSATGAHFMCILRKAVEAGVDVKTATPSTLRPLAEECVREDKLVPIRKFLKRLTLYGA